MIEQIINFDLITGSVQPFMVVLYFLIGYVVTDKLYLHDAISFLQGRKAWAVALFCLPIMVLTLVTGTHWEDAILSFTFTIAIYDNILKHFKTFMP